MHVLFGTVLAIDVNALLLIASITSITLLVIAALYRPLAVESSTGVPARGRRRRRRIPRDFHHARVLNLVASFQAFGTLLAIGPMLLPAAAARCWTQKVWPMITLATAIGMAAALAGFSSPITPNLPQGRLL